VTFGILSLRLFSNVIRIEPSRELRTKTKVVCHAISSTKGSELTHHIFIGKQLAATGGKKDFLCLRELE
jgi:hypothetical protein